MLNEDPDDAIFDLDRWSDPAAEVDTISEVDALYRSQRRLAMTFFALFAVIVLGVITSTILVSWWTDSRLIGGMSPSFVVAAIGLYGFFVLLATAATRFANNVEDWMVGHQSGPGRSSPS